MTDGGFTAVVPVGIGVNFATNPDYSLGVELGGGILSPITSTAIHHNIRSRMTFIIFCHLHLPGRYRPRATDCRSFMSKRKY